MEKRPEFNEILSYSEFKKYYWYRKELISICRQLNIDASGTKQELNHNIEEYFCGNLVKKQKNTINQNKTKKEEFSLDCPLLECGFSFNRKFREFFSIHTGIKNFKFTADMAEMWRKVKRTNDKTITLGDMLEVYYGKSDYARYEKNFQSSLRKYQLAQNQDDSITLKNYLLYWFDEIFSKRIEPTTQMVSKFVLNSYILPFLDTDIKIKFVSVEYIDELLKK